MLVSPDLGSHQVVSCRQEGEDHCHSKELGDGEIFKVPGSLPISGYFQTPFKNLRVTSKHTFRVLGVGTREFGV